MHIMFSIHYTKYIIDLSKPAVSFFKCFIKSVLFIVLSLGMKAKPGQKLESLIINIKNQL